MRVAALLVPPPNDSHFASKFLSQRHFNRDGRIVCGSTDIPVCAP